jgi:hypothetical protein
MSRQKLAQPTIVQVKLTLRPGEDDDLISFFQACPDRLRVASVKQALRNGGLSFTGESETSDDDVLAALESLLG